MHTATVLMLAGLVLSADRPPDRARLALSLVDQAIAIAQAAGDEDRLAEAAELQASADRFEEALATANAIGDASIRATALESIALAQAGRGRTQAAIATARRSAESGRVLARIARVQAKRREFAEALQTLEQVESRREKLLGLLAVARRQAESGDRAGASKLLMRVPENLAGSADDAIIVRKLAIATAYVGDADAMDAHMAKLLRTGREDDWVQETQAQIAGGYASAGNIEAAVSTAASISDWWHRGNAYRRIARHLLNTGAAAKAHARVREIKPGEALWREDVLSDLVDWYLKNGQRAAAIGAASELLPGQHQVRAWLRVAASAETEDTLSNAALLRRARDGIARENRDSKGAELLADLAMFHATLGDADTARAVLAEAVDRAKSLDDDEELLVGSFRGHLSRIVDVQLATGDREEARKLLQFSWDRMSNDDRRGLVLGEVAYSSYIEIAARLVEAGAFPTALELAAALEPGAQDVASRGIAQALGQTRSFDALARWMDSLPEDHRPRLLLSAARGALTASAK